jgi:hypothetical protein
MTKKRNWGIADTEVFRRLVRQERAESWGGSDSRIDRTSGVDLCTLI